MAQQAALVRIASVEGIWIALQQGAEVPEGTKVHEVKFGKTDKIVKLAFPIGSESPTGILFVGRNGRMFLANISRYPQTIKETMVFHGSKQKLGDEYADLDTVDDCFEALIALDGRLAEGKWTVERQGFAGVSVLMKALMEVYDLTEEGAREFLKPLTVKEKAALRASPELKPAIDKIEAERGKGADVTALLDKLRKQTPIGE